MRGKLSLIGTPRTYAPATCKGCSCHRGLQWWGVRTGCACRMGPPGCLILLLPTLRSGLCVSRQERDHSCQLLQGDAPLIAVATPMSWQHSFPRFFSSLVPPCLMRAKRAHLQAQHPWHGGPRGPGQNRGSWGCFCVLGASCLGRICGGSYWYPTEHSGDEEVGGRWHVGPPQSYANRRRILLEDPSMSQEPTWELCLLPRMQPRLTGYEDEWCPWGS